MILSSARSGKREETPGHKRARRTGTCTGTHWLSHNHTERYANNRIEADHSQLKRRLRPMRGLKTDHGARIITTGPGFVQNIRRGHYELGTEEPMNFRVTTAFDELALAI